MLRYSIFIVFLLLSLSKLHAQDLLVTADGDTIAIEIIELNDKYLVYHKIDLIEKRIFTTPHQKLDKILYSDGSEFQFNVVINPPKKIQSEEKKELAEDYGILYVENGIFAPSIRTLDERLNSQDVIELYEDMENQQAINLFKKGRTQNMIGNIIGFPAGFFLGRQLYNTFSERNKVNTPILIASTIASIISITLNVRGIRKIKKSVKSYNEDVLFELGGTEHGIGLQMKF